LREYRTFECERISSDERFYKLNIKSLSYGRVGLNKPHADPQKATPLVRAEADTFPQ